MLKIWLTAFILLGCVLSSGCAINPVTGEKQLMLVGEDWELQVGRQDGEFVGAVGIIKGLDDVL